MIYISKKKLDEIKRELQELKTKTRQEIAKRIEEATKLGDLSENSEYAEAKEAQEFNERKIAELEEVLRNAIIIDRKRKDIGSVQIGSIVELKSGLQTLKFHIVGPKESDPAAAKISNESPMGSILLTKQVGDVVELVMPNGSKKKYTIKKIY